MFTHSGLDGTRRPVAVRNQRLSRFMFEVCLTYPAVRGPVLPPAGVPLGPAAFQGFYHPESTFPGKAPIAQLTRINAGHRLFAVPLTRITSVPECAVPSVGFLWDRPPCRGLVGFLWGSQKPLTCLTGPTRAPQILQLLDADDYSPE